MFIIHFLTLFIIPLLYLLGFLEQKKKKSARSLKGLDSTWPKGDNEVERKRRKPAKKGSNDEEDADISALQNNVCQRDKGGRKVQPLERREKKRPVGPGMQGCRNVGRGKREKLVNGRKIKANGEKKQR